MKWLLLIALLFSLTGCWNDGDFFDDGGDYDMDVDTDIEAGDYDLYWDDIETFDTADFPEPAQMISLLIWMLLFHLSSHSRSLISKACLITCLSG